MNSESNIRMTSDGEGNTVLLRRHIKTEQIVEKITIGDTDDIRKFAEDLNDLADARDALDEFNRKQQTGE